MIGANLSPPFNTTRASHAVMTARDLDRTQEFYCDVRMLTDLQGLGGHSTR